MKWPTFFKEFFKSHRREIDTILDAQGCREGWLQGALFLYANGDLKTNDTSQKFDLASNNDPMLAEIKICGGDYQGKMRDLIEADIEKLAKAPVDQAKYFILLIDTRKLESSLGKWLKDFRVPADEEVKSQNFLARIWKIKESL